MKKTMKLFTAMLLCMAIAFAFGACGSDEQAEEETTEAAKAEQSVEIDPQAETLTIIGQASKAGDTLEEKTYTADELAALGTETVTYSGRNKKVENERQFFEKTGVDLKTALEDAGVSAEDVDDAIIKVTCSDEYQMEYKVSDLYDGLVTFKDNETNDCEEVGAMIAISEEEGDYPSPFQIVFGQASYDNYDNSAQDFNTQKWGSYIVLMEVSFPEE